MSDPLNNLKLNPSMLAALYGRSLIDNPAVVQQQPVSSQSEKPGTFNFAGSNRKNVTVLIRSAVDPLPAPQHAFLEKMLKACRLETGDVAIVNLQQNDIAMEDVVARLTPRQVLAFGTGAGSELFRMQNVDGIKYLNAPALEELMKETDSSKQLKAKLWNELKSIFAIQ